MDNKELSRAEALAKEILILSRNTLLVNFRFLDAALSQFSFVPKEDESLMTDGEYIIYGARHVLNLFKAQQEQTNRDYLHMVLHCVYRHMFAKVSMDRTLWDLACDIAVENVINGLGVRCITTRKAMAQAQFLSAFEKECGMLTAEKIYNYIKNLNPSPAKVAEMRGYFYADNHEIWYMTESQKKQRFGIGGSSSPDSDESDSGSDKISLCFSSLSQTWKEISERMQVDMETFSKNQGNSAGSLLQNLKEVNREKYDYTSFLKKFAVMGEVMKINDDEFDYVFYTYGLELYEKMPLIEPLEYKDVKRIKEFVIAIDTSGSVEGDEVQAFIQKTYNILKSEESFFSKINIHIIQCDADIQEHVKITSQEEFDNYLKNMKLRGFGGTDFRPVFSLTDELITQKEFINLKGLIYFTDGYGTFPEKKPPYETAFVFVRDNYEIPEVPPWAIKLVLEKNDLQI